MDFSYYWHDYETFGANPARDRPAQFAGIRTDSQFNLIGEPLTLYCQPPNDRLPHPEACLLTGITPQQATTEGMIEVEFARRIHQALATPNTCAVGYNNLRFDDEITRYLLYRNFYDPYAREWQHGNSRWDIIDMVRACRALRPEGMEWPNHEDGTPDFRLEAISQANQLHHSHAHDALSDVQATIALAKRIDQQQPKLFQYLLQLRNKRAVAPLLDIIAKKPVLHTSARFPASRLCTTLVMPLAPHPTNKNGIISYDLTVDPEPLLTLSAEEIRERFYTPADQLPAGQTRVALKVIHINRCPVIMTAKLLDDTVSARLSIDRQQTWEHYQQLLQAKGLTAKLQAVFATTDYPELTDPDLMLYSGGFFSDTDKQTMDDIRASTPEALAKQTFHFEDPRLNDMLFRYRARNYPQSLSTQESQQWEDYRLAQLHHASNDGLTIDQYRLMIQQKMANHNCSEREQKILEDLLKYGDELLSKN